MSPDGGIGVLPVAINPFPITALYPSSGILCDTSSANPAYISFVMRSINPNIVALHPVAMGYVLIEALAGSVGYGYCK